MNVPWRRRRKVKPTSAVYGTGSFITPAMTTTSTGATGVTTPYWYSASSTSTSFTYPKTYATYPKTYAPTPPEPLKDLGMAIEPIVGLRSFTVDFDMVDAPVLCAFNGTGWPHRIPLSALCGGNVLADHDPPGENCQCGIYAWREGDYENLTGDIYGEVYLWGDVLICPDGYRAEFAYPKNLTLRVQKRTRAILRLRDGLEEAYGVPVAIKDLGS